MFDPYFSLSSLLKNAKKKLMRPKTTLRPPSKILKKYPDPQRIEDQNQEKKTTKNLLLLTSVQEEKKLAL